MEDAGVKGSRDTAMGDGFGQLTAVQIGGIPC